MVHSYMKKYVNYSTYEYTDDCNDICTRATKVHEIKGTLPFKLIAKSISLQTMSAELFFSLDRPSSMAHLESSILGAPAKGTHRVGFQPSCST